MFCFGGRLREYMHMQYATMAPWQVHVRLHVEEAADDAVWGAMALLRVSAYCIAASLRTGDEA
jgi:hypothetical protein